MTNAELAAIDWHTEYLSEWGDTRELVAALRALVLAAPGDHRASDRVRRAVGNDHCGTYFPAVLDVIRALGRMLREGSLRVKAAVVDVLCDWPHYCPERGYDIVQTPDGPRPLRRMVEQELRALRGDLESFLAGGDIDEATQTNGRDLLSVLEEDWEVEMPDGDALCLADRD